MAPSPRSPSSPSGGGQPAAAEKPGIELSFDGGPDDSDDSVYPIRNTASEGSDSLPFDPSGPKLVFTLAGDAARTTDTAGRYGRAIELDPADGTVDYLQVTGIYPGFDTPDLYAWWQLDGGGGVFWWEECRFEVGLDASHRIYVEVFDDDCVASTTTTSTLTWPDFSGGWHHLLVHRYVPSASGQQFALRLDFGTPEVLSTASLPSPGVPPSEIRFGEGIDGRVDELQAADYPPGIEADFDYDPVYCGPNPPPGVVCFEATTKALAADLPAEITWDLPVRYKVVYDQSACTQAPCRVVFVPSGGGSCSDNYARVADDLIDKLVGLDPPQDRSHLAVVTADPICWTPGFEGYPAEITQYLAVKADLASETYLDLSGEYYATGCSHGAKKVVEWVVQDDAGADPGDRPKRVFARSAGAIGEHVDCVYHESWCGEKQKLWDELHFEFSPEICFPPILDPWDHDHGIACIDTYIDDQVAYIDEEGYIDAELLLNREVGLSWGENTTGVVCAVDPEHPELPSRIACPEEGGFAATDASRQFRDAWKAAEIQHLPPNTRTGYFIENDTADCRHCGLTDTQMDCVVAYLEGGRSALSSNPCLQLNEGDAAADCSIYPK